MFILHIRLKKCLMPILVLAIAVAAMGLIAKSKDTETVAVTAQENISLKAETEEQRQAFLKQIQADVTNEPGAVMAVVLPVTFDDVYKNYNQLQKQSGFDLEKYAGKEIIKYTYAGTDETVTLLVYRNKIIGGDRLPNKEDAKSQPLFVI